jgi:hypothetical protein
MDLADELAADFDYEEEAPEEVKPDAATLKRSADAMEEDGDEDEEAAEGLAVPEGGIKPADELDADDVAKLDTASMASVSAVAKLAGSAVFKEALEVSGPRPRFGTITLEADSSFLAFTEGRPLQSAAAQRPLDVRLAGIQAHRPGQQLCRRD